MTSLISINDIYIDSALQTRVRLNEVVTQEYTALMRDGVQFPPVVLFDDGKRKYLVDGFHRLNAAKRAGQQTIEVEVHMGEKYAGFLYSLKANAAHGLQRTNEDKRHGVLKLLEDFEYIDKSDREIAAICAVSHTFVSKVRARNKQPAARNLNLMAKPIGLSYETSGEVATLPVDPVQEYDPRDDVLKELAEENEALTDRLSIQAMDATEEEKALAAETIAKLREENRMLVMECNTLKQTRNTYMNQAAEAIKQCNSYQHVIKKLNTQIAELQAKLKQHPPEEEPLPF